MLFGGLVLMVSSAGAGTWLGWQNRDVVVRVRVGHDVWTGHLYAVLVVGALLACWLLLGAAFVQCRIAERRRARAARTAAPAAPAAVPGKRGTSRSAPAHARGAALLR